MSSIHMRTGIRTATGRGLARCAGVAGLVLLLAACETEPKKPLGTVGHVEGFVGEVAADDPAAVQVGQEVLSAGGSAADAAVAMTFALSVTLPSRASLGGGGMCLVHDNPTQKTEALEFIPRASAQNAGDSAVPVAIPAAPRAMFALHDRFGRLLWEQLLAPAENLARRGAPVGAALEQDIQLASGVLGADRESMRIFGSKEGGVLKEGETLVQTDLGILIGTLRTRGVGELYEGMLAPAVARRYNEAAGSANGSVSAKDLSDYQPAWEDPVEVDFGDDALYFPPPPSAAGLVAAAMWQMLTLDERYPKAPAAERPHLFAEIAMRAFADRGRWYKPGGLDKSDIDEILSEARAKELLESYSADQATAAASLNPAPVAMPENPAATSFAVIDREGSGVACTLTMNNLFGLGRIARGTGIVVAAAPVKGSAATALLPFLAVGKGGAEIRMAAAASGGAAAPAALVTVALETLVEDRSLEDAMAAKRIHHGGVPDITVVEKGEDSAVLSALADHGHKTFEVDALGDVEAAYCPGGVLKDSDSCTAASDPRGHRAGPRASQ
jgi:gamma-glutamyltranspeptidase/glutathione hydrolase